MNLSVSKFIVFEYLSGRATTLEKQSVEDWLSNRDNIEVFHEWLMEWELRSPQFSPDTNFAFSNLMNTLDNSEVFESKIPISVMPKSMSIFRPRLMAIAASLLLLIGGFAYFKDEILFKTYKTDYAEVSSFLLEDGSRVSLNANSSLKVPRWGFDSEVREVLLQGEAEFSITHTLDNKRFLVKTSDKFQVEVLGTEFSVFSRERGTKVVLNRGKIRIDYVQGNKTEKLLMKPGDLVTLNNAGKIELKRTPEPQNFSAWKTQKFVFNGTSVKEILLLMDENFGVKITSSDEEVASRTISGTFKAQSADELLQVLYEVLNLKLIKTDNGNKLTNQTYSDNEKTTTPF